MQAVQSQLTSLLGHITALNWLRRLKWLLKMRLEMTKKFSLTDDVDNKFSIDLKVTTGDGLSTGLATPIVVDLHEASIVNTAAEAKAGMTQTNFLSHAQVRINDELNAYIHEVGGAGAAGVNAANVAALNADGRLFKKLVSGSNSQHRYPCCRYSCGKNYR